MRAAFANRAAFEHRNHIGAANRRKAVSDDEHRAPSHQIVQRALHEHLGFGIELGSRFIENQNRRIFQERARNRQPLALAAGKPLAAVANQSLIAAGAFPK